MTVYVVLTRYGNSLVNIFDNKEAADKFCTYISAMDRANASDVVELSVNSDGDEQIKSHKRFMAEVLDQMSGVSSASSGPSGCSGGCGDCSDGTCSHNPDHDPNSGCCGGCG